MKTEQDVKESLEDVKQVILETINDEWATACDQWDFQTAEDYEAYGDTYVSTGKYITDESEWGFREEFKRENDVDEFIEKLKKNNDFREVVKKFIENYAYTTDLYV